MIDYGLLKDKSIFMGLADEELSVISKITRKMEFKLGETIFSTSDSGQSIFIIRSGEVKVCVAAPDGELFTLTILKDGDTFGEMSFIDQTARSATVMAISDVEAFVIDGADFETIVDDNPRIIHTIMRNLVHNIHSIVRGMNSRYIEMVNYMWGRKRFC